MPKALPFTFLRDPGQILPHGQYQGEAMKVKKVAVFECPECGQVHEDPEEASECCPRDPLEQIDYWKCGECDELYEDKEEAKECCKE